MPRHSRHLVQRGADSVKRQASAARDRQRDFDFNLGTWRTHVKRLLHPLTGSSSWAEYDGTSVVSKVWDGRVNVNEFFTENPNDPLEGLTLRTHNVATHLWSMYWANSRDGLVVVPQIGQFKAGHGEFYAQDVIDDKSVLVKFDWSAMMSKSPHFEQLYSNDGGKNWEANWISDQNRVN